MIKLCIENVGHPSALQGKPVALLGGAAGRIGAIESIEQLRGVCGHVGAATVPKAVSIAAASAAGPGRVAPEPPSLTESRRLPAVAIQPS